MMKSESNEEGERETVILINTCLISMPNSRNRNITVGMNTEQCSNHFPVVVVS
jgi:hypothetical protein